MDFDAVLDEAEKVPDETLSVKVCVNRAIARKRAELLTELEEARKAEAERAAADARLGGAIGDVDTSASDAALKAFKKHEPQVQKALVELKFTRMDADKWTHLTRVYPIRVDVALDRHYGYNFDAVSKHAARLSGVRVDGGTETPLTEEQWDRLLSKKILSGPDLARIVDAIWTLNEYNPNKDIEALVKGSGAA